MFQLHICYQQAIHSLCKYMYKTFNVKCFLITVGSHVLQIYIRIILKKMVHNKKISYISSSCTILPQTTLFHSHINNFCN